MSKRKAIRSQQLLGGLFKSHEDMADSLEALLDFLWKRYRQGPANDKPTSILGFALEKLTVEFSGEVDTIQVEARFAAETVRVVVPCLPHESKDEQRSRSLAIVDRLLPAVKETHLRAAGQLYHFLDSDARRRMVEDYKRRIVERS